MTQSLKDFGIKSTDSANAVLAILERKGEPLDVSTIADNLKNDGLSTDLVTVYRILNKFYEKGLATRIEIGEGKYRYEIQKKHHHHLICQNCGKIEDIEVDFIEEIEKKIKNKKGFLVKSHSLEFFGICKSCLK
jgi:Fur family transcriptional regulator, ferric uptake regulator